MQSAVLSCRTHIYHRREPEKEVLYQAIAENLETFPERLRAEGHELPKYVVESLNFISITPRQLRFSNCLGALHLSMITAC